MTANQIAAQALKEDQRHNEVYETETERHNKVVEALEQEKNSITQSYYNEKNSLDKWYNEAYIEYLNSSEADKVALESQLNDIKRMQEENDAWYKREMAAYSKVQTEADVEYKAQMGEIGYMNAELQARRLEYEKHQWDTENYLKTVEYGIRHQELLENERWHNLNYDIGMAQVQESIRAHDLENEIKIRQTNAQFTSNYLRSQELEWTKEYQNRQLLINEAMLPFQQSNLEAQTKYMESNRALTVGKTIDLFNPFKASPQATDLFKGLINLF